MENQIFNHYREVQKKIEEAIAFLESQGFSISKIPDEIKIDIHDLTPNHSVVFFVGDEGYFATFEQTTEVVSNPKFQSGLNDEMVSEIIEKKSIVINDCHKYTDECQHLYNMKASDDIVEALRLKLMDL
tara:strand:+ start:125 stop:511 length:387 start_codon:yes stop_codon:yes gene_type:complete